MDGISYGLFFFFSFFFEISGLIFSHRITECKWVPSQAFTSLFKQTAHWKIEATSQWATYTKNNLFSKLNIALANQRSGHNQKIEKLFLSYVSRWRPASRQASMWRHRICIPTFYYPCLVTHLHNSPFLTPGSTLHWYLYWKKLSIGYICIQNFTQMLQYIKLYILKFTTLEIQTVRHRDMYCELQTKEHLRIT